MATGSFSRKIGAVLERAKSVAVEYYKLRERPLGITGEIGEYEAARLLHLEIAPPRSPGFDALDPKSRRKYQIKARAFDISRPWGGQRIGRIKLTGEWGAVLLVILDRAFTPIGIYEAKRNKIKKALTDPGSKARNERGALSISKFKSIGRKVWPRT